MKNSSQGRRIFQDKTFIPPSMYYTYVLKRQNNDWYIGYTNDLRRRLAEHQNKWECELIYYEAYQSMKVARERERKLKHYGSAWRALKKRIIA